MKKYLFLVILVFSSTILKAQTYSPLIRSNIYWDVMHSGPEICNYSSGDRYYFDGDTMIAGHQYMIVRAYSIININPGPFCPPYAVDTNYSYVKGFLREDTLQWQVYIYDEALHQDDLLYDFSVSEGDTLNSFFYAGQGSVLIVDSTDSVSLFNGATRKVVYLSSGEYYVESIGGSLGLLSPLIPLEWNDKPICVKSDSISLYWGLCYEILGISTHSFDNDVLFSPNPASDNIAIKGVRDNNYLVIVYNVYGEQILKSETFNSETNINVSSLKNGVYFLFMLELERGLSFSKLLSVTR